MRILALCAILFVAGCDTLDSQAPDVQLFIQTDRDAYTLEHLAWGHRFAMEVAITNQGEQTVYLARACGDGPEPARRFQRVPASDVPVALDASACARPGSRTAPDPIEIAPGATYVDARQFDSGFVKDGAFTNRALKTGSFVLTYTVLDIRRAARQTVVEPIAGAGSSNTFSVVMAP